MWCLAARDSARAAHIPQRPHHVTRCGVNRHTRSGADDEFRTHGLDHGVVALCLLSYIRKTCKINPRPVPKLSCSKFLKSSAISSIAGFAPMHKALGVGNKKGPDPFGIRASAYRAWRVCGYAAPSPGCVGSSFRSSEWTFIGTVTARLANDLPAVARANAARPCAGRPTRSIRMKRWVFTMKPF